MPNSITHPQQVDGYPVQKPANRDQTQPFSCVWHSRISLDVGCPNVRDQLQGLRPRLCPSDDFFTAAPFHYSQQGIRREDSPTEASGMASWNGNRQVIGDLQGISTDIADNAYRRSRRS
jgi:hypothetical protein